ncbi:MAG: hypothetical protein HY290_01505 [Planctomycetia bacterium]|nr:hypothetical protein [Planctomycetia bacterium]
MSRMHHALLRAATLCLLILACGAPAPAFEGLEDPFMTAPAQTPPAAAFHPAGGPLENDTDFPTQDIPFQQQEVNNTQAQLDSLQQQFNALQARFSAKTVPFIEVHAVSQMDSGIFGQDEQNIKAVGLLNNGSDFRRSRLAANGALTENMNYFFQVDFSFPGRPTFTDVWMEVTGLPVFGNIRAGQWKQPFSLEVVSSFRYTTFAERSVLFQSFAPFRHIAIGFYDWSQDERMTWAFSTYRAGQDQFGDALSYGNTGNYAVVGRTTGLAWYECEGTQYLHLGAAYNYVAPQALAGTDKRQASFGTIPEYFIGQNVTVTNGIAGVSQPTSAIDGTPKFVNTKNFDVNHYNLIGGEALWVQGPLSVQAEGNYLAATRANGVGANFAGMYTTFGYFLTGEHRPYLKKSGAIDRIKVLNNFIKLNHDEEWGLGGWEVATRLSYIDLNSKDIQGGRMFDVTAGLNWYLNSYAKIQFNYIRSNLTNAAFGDSHANIYGIRGQFDF